MKGMRALLLVAALTIAAGLLFGLAPGIDVDAARLFGTTGTGFVMRLDATALVMRQVGLWMPIIVAACCLLVLLAPIVNPLYRSRIDARSLAAIVLTFVLGPGLLVNVVLKDNWHRPRPIQVVEFGGVNQFKPWWDTSGACNVNCSFVSGEVSGAVAMATAAALVPAAYAGSALMAAIAFAVVVAFLRMAFGGHFLSDIVMAALFTEFIAVALMTLFHDPRWRYGRPGVLDGDIRALAFRLRMQASRS
ncbi:phosphatase PAP2 family protein [Labrys monachus]|uniref:Membrane-associated PAP2 superfamily phosphatase n=1 Tax=Labrys monachus TaxID=217067 RepID=A0ABU0FM06_9HYPH|nr:phosphatase PAP2 family protein [Labrys monachus]MDQ0395633.1 membrane-associated PAP2 superfamily phosphatase [Labrys monachus]